MPIALIVWAAASIALNVGMHRFAYGAMLPALRRDMGLDYLGGGFLGTIHLVGYLVGTLVAPILVQRMGAVRLSVAGHGLVAIGAIACAWAPVDPLFGVPVLSAGRLATGVGAGFAILSVLIVTFAAVRASQRPMASAIVWSGMGLAIVASGLATAALLGPSIGWRLAFVATAMLATALAFGFPPPGTSARVEAEAPLERFSEGMAFSGRLGFLMLSYFMFGLGYITIATFAGARMIAADATSASIGSMWAAFGIAAVIGAALTVPMMRDPRTKPWALAASLCTACLGSVFLVASGSADAQIGALLVGLGAAATPTIVSAHARERVTAEDYAAVFSLATAAMGIGQLLGPVIAGALADIAGSAAAPLFAAAAYGIGTAAALADIRYVSAAGVEPARDEIDTVQEDSPSAN